MNSIVSAAAVATATAIPNQSATAVAADLGTTSFPELATRFVGIRARWSELLNEEGDSAEFDDIVGELHGVVEEIFARAPQSLTDVAWQASAALTVDNGFWNRTDPKDQHMIKLIDGIQAIAAPLPIPFSASSTAPMKADDPIFAAIDAHRSAHEELDKAIKAADVRCRPQKQASIIVGYRDGTEASWIKTDGGGGTLIVRPTGQKRPVHASNPDQIRRNVPEELQGDARKTWIADREAELEAAEQRIAKRLARTKIGKLKAAADKAAEIEEAALWDLIWTTPTTAGALAELLRYCREQGGMNELVWRSDEWLNVFEWTIECAVCALAGLPRPPMNKIVAGLWDEYAD